MVQNGELINNELQMQKTNIDENREVIGYKSEAKIWTTTI